MSRGYWVKPAKSVYAPTSLAAVVVRGRPVGPESRHGKTMSGWLDAAVCVSSWRGRRWTVTTSRTFDTPDSLHDYLESRASHKGRTWVVSPVASHALTLSGFWDRLDTFGAAWEPRPPKSKGGTPAPQPDAAYIFRSCILRGKPDIITYHVGGKCLTWVSGMQYLPMDEGALAESLGFAWPRSGGTPAVGSFGTADPTDRAEVWLLAFQRMADWWREIGGGPWRPTIGGLADSYFRRRIEPKAVLAHQDEYARTLEEGALFGGRASTWYYGTVGRPGVKADDGSVGPPRSPYGDEPGPVELWDVSSMYPTILANERFPVRHLYNWPKPGLPFVRAMMDENLVIARVTIRTDVPEYPVRTDDGVTFPVGEFVTNLCGPELAFAIESGHVVTVHHASSYQPGRPFALAAQELIDLRRGMGDSGDKCQEAFVKLLSNNFGGRMAMKRVGLTPRLDVFPELGMSWGGWSEGAGDKRRRFVVMAGLVWELTAPRHSGRPLASLFCFLTAYGRALMRDVRATLPPRSVVSQDTDGVWVLRPTATQRRRAVALARERGFRLDTRRRVSDGRWFGPKHYWNNSGWTLSGIRQERQWMGTLKVRDDYTVNPVISNPREAPRHVWECTRESDLTLAERDGQTGEDGWIRPSVVGPWVPPTLG